MPYRLVFEERDGYLYILMEGPESYESALLFWQDLYRKAREEEICHFLIEDRVVGRLTRTELFFVSEMVGKLFHNRVIAYLDPKETTYQDNQYGESIVNSRGGDATVFRAMEEAIRYLQERIKKGREEEGEEKKEEKKEEK